MTTAPGSDVRLFVAIEVTDEWREALAQAQSGLREALEPGGVRLRYVRPEGVHLTLKFLGSVREDRLASVMAAIEDACAQAPNLTLALSGAGSFGDRRGPRVIWVGVEDVTPPGGAALSRLVHSLEASFAEAGFPRERGFRPHLTLARVPEEMGREQRDMAGEAISSIERRGEATMSVASISLMRSHLERGGARYERLAAFPLALE